LLLLAACLFWMVKGKAPAAPLLLVRIGLPALIVLIPTAVIMGYYNLRVTGHALHLPYLVHEESYAVAPPFLWQRPRPEPVYHHQELRDFYAGWALSTYTAQHSLMGFISKGMIRKLRILAVGYFRLLALAVPLLALPWALSRDRWARLALLLCGAFTSVLLFETWMLPHYAAPITGLFFIVALQGMRHLRLWRWRGHAAGLCLARISLVLSLAAAVNTAVQLARAEETTGAWAFARARLLDQLKQDGARHLIIVRYGPGHVVHQEWVYNEADIDRAPVVWARGMDAARDHELLEYFKDRRVWLLEADAQSVRLIPFPMDQIPGFILHPRP
jgi:hypothetical protein